MISEVLELEDGVKLDCRVYGETGKWLAIANGYGASFGIWRDVLPELEKHYRILMWDYRGTFNSTITDQTPVPSISDHVYDLHFLLDHYGIDQVMLCGWSVGVQVSLEFERAFPDRVSALILHNGLPDHLLHRVFGGVPGFPALFHALTKTMPFAWPRIKPLMDWLSDQPWLTPLCHEIGLVKGIPYGFVPAFKAIMSLDLARYFAMACKADEHQLWDHLPEISVPVLVTAGSRDCVSPPSELRTLAERIPNAKYVEFEGNTHYAAFESPALVSGVFLEFLNSIGL